MINIDSSQKVGISDITLIKRKAGGKKKLALHRRMKYEENKVAVKSAMF